MKFKIVSSVLLGLALFSGMANAQTANTTSTGKRWAVVNLTEPVMVGRQILMGRYLIVHDDVKMAKGEPCTTIYRFDPKTGPKEQVIAFMCLPKKVAAQDTTTIAVTTDPALGLRALRAYEFAGDAEIHGLPSDVR